MSGDRIVAIDGREIRTWREVSDRIKSSGGRAVTLLIERGGKITEVRLVPELKKLKNIFGEEEEVSVIGVTAAGNLKVEKLNPLVAIGKAFVRTWELIALTAEGFLKIIQSVVPLSTLGGPIMIAQMAGQQAEQGVLNLFYFMALLSINLGFLNLLPIPVLDGGHLFFLTIEFILGRPLTIRQMELAQQIGIFILGALMLLVFYNDIARLLGFGAQLPGP